LTHFTNPHIFIALQSDLATIELLLNAAYRGEESNKGWTTESHLIAGATRTTMEVLQNTFNTDDSNFLLYKNEANETIACVNLQQHNAKLYLGMFAVAPTLQGGGVGKVLLQASEELAIYLHCTSIYMTVISVRTELIDWYKRNGYVDTGERKPFVEDAYSGKHLQALEFMVLEKVI
jgi:ribosomal protein S18 acetylase RimI-like enzyme